MTNYDMIDLLRKYRYDGRRFWFRDPNDIWHPISARDLALALAVHVNMPKKQAIRLRNSLKADSKEINDPQWAEQLRWLNFRRGRQLYVVLDRVEFCDPRTGRSTRSMSVRDFNKKLSKDCPSKGPSRAR